MRKELVSRLKLIGRPSFETEEGKAVIFPKKAYVIALLLIDAAEARTLRREDLARTLWPDLTSNERMGNLRPLLTRIRRAQLSAGVAPFLITSLKVTLTLAAIRCDIVDLREAIEVGNGKELVQAGESLQGALLEGCDNGPPSLGYWLQNKRGELIAAYADAARKILCARALRQSPEDEIALARRLMGADPTEEESYRTLIREAIDRGDIQEGRRLFDRLSKTLAAFGHDNPSADIAELLKGLRNDSAHEAMALQSSHGSPFGARLITAFKVGSHVQPLLLIPASDSALHGAAFYRFVDDLIVQLWQSGAARIVLINGQASNAITHAHLQNAYQMSVGAGLEDSGRVSLRLVHTSSGSVIWAGLYYAAERRTDNSSANIANHIIQALRTHYSDAYENGDKASSLATELIVHANQALLVAELPSVRKARRLFRAALQIDDKQIEAHAGLSRTMWFEWLLRAGQDANLLAAAENVARKGLSYQPDSPVIHRELGMIAQYSRRSTLALEHLKRAHEAQPVDDTILVDYCDALISAGDSKTAVSVMLKSRPSNIEGHDFRLWVAASGLYLVGDYEAAISSLDKMKTKEPTYKLRAACHAMRGDREGANTYMLKSTEINPSFNFLDWLAVCPMISKADVERCHEGFSLAGFTVM